MSKKKSEVAVVGVGCLFPGASNKTEFWETILARRQQFRHHLDERLPMSEYFDSDRKAEDKLYGNYAAYVDHFKFDWAKRLIPKGTVEATDIAHWLALEASIQAIEDAGYNISAMSESNTIVVVGNTLTGEQMRSSTMRVRWPFVRKTLVEAGKISGFATSDIERLSENMRQIYKSVFHPITEDTLAGGLSNTIAGRICNFMNLKGGGYTVDGACSSSLIAVATAAERISLGISDLAIAGGVDVSLDTFELIGFAKTGALSPNTMHVYDKRAQGFIPGEGAGFVVLKKSEAKRS